VGKALILISLRASNRQDMLSSSRALPMPCAGGRTSVAIPVLHDRGAAGGACELHAIDDWIGVPIRSRKTSAGSARKDMQPILTPEAARRMV
jgi:hypothetical protein